MLRVGLNALLHSSEAFSCWVGGFGLQRSEYVSRILGEPLFATESIITCVMKIWSMLQKFIVRIMIQKVWFTFYFGKSFIYFYFFKSFTMSTDRNAEYVVIFFNLDWLHAFQGFFFLLGAGSVKNFL